MKKKIIILAIAIVAAMSVNAQSTDGFFSAGEEYRSVEDVESAFGLAPKIMAHGMTKNQPAPVGSGLLILSGLGLAYGLKKN